MAPISGDAQPGDGVKRDDTDVSVFKGAVAKPRSEHPDPDWSALLPERLKSAEPVSLERNPLQQARIAVSVRQGEGRVRREQLRRLRRHLDEQVRGVVTVNGRSLLLLGGRVCQIGQELVLPRDVAGGESSVLSARVKSVEAGRLVLLLGDGSEEDGVCEEWVYTMSDFLVQR